MDWIRSVTFIQSCRGSLKSLSSKSLAGLRAYVLRNWMQGWSRSRTWYWVTQQLDIHLFCVPLNKASTKRGSIRNSACPKLNLSTSFTSIAVAAMSLIYVGHPGVTRSILLDRYATGLFQGPSVFMRIPLAMPLALFTCKWNVLVISGRARAGSDTSALFKVLKAFC